MADKCTGDGLTEPKETSAPFPPALPQTCFSTDLEASVRHGVGGVGTSSKGPMGSQDVPMESQGPKLASHVFADEEGRHVLRLLAGLHTVLGLSKTHISSSTNGG
jgi:hypothetical protein